jgi:pimeloyl-ACP methyl ester carboxylesterase
LKTGERSVSVDIMGSRMTALDAGEGDVVVLGSSFLWDAEMWRPQIDALSQHCRVIVPHLWGHGGSGAMPAATKDLRDLARQNLALLDHLGIQRFAMVGLSVGGMWGAELALLVPEQVTALALLDSFLGAEPADSRARYFAVLDAVAAARSLPDAVLDAVVPLFFSPTVQATAPDLPARFRARLKEWDADRLVDAVVPLGRLIFGRRDALADLARLTLPAVVMTGQQDIPRPVAEGRQMATAMGCPFIELPGAGHISSLEAPGAVTDHLLAFLAQAHPKPPEPEEKPQEPDDPIAEIEE